MNKFHTIIVMIFVSFIMSSRVNAGDNGYWTPIEQPLATDITRTLLSTDEGLYAGSVSGLYFSPDNGQTWQLITDHSISAGSLLETKSKHILVGAYRKGLIKINPKTKTWQVIALPDAIYINDLVKIDNKIFVTSASNNGIAGVYLSIDDGVTWQPTSLPENWVVSLSSPNKKTLFASTFNGLYLSNDLGTTWEKNNVGLPDNIPVSQVIRVNNQLLAATGSLRTPGRGIFRLNSVSNQWEHYGTGMPTKITVNAITLKGRQLIAATETFLSKKEGLFISDDFGKSWHSIDFSNKSGQALIVSTTGDIFVGTEGSGLWKSSDLTHWTSASKGIKDWAVFSLYQTKDRDLLASTESGIWGLPSNSNKWQAPDIQRGALPMTRTNNGKLLSSAENNLLVADEKTLNWQSISFDGQYLINLYVDGDRWYVVDVRKPAKYSDDQGKTWQELSLPDKQPIRPIIKTNNGDLLVSNNSGLYRSTDNAKTWSLIKEDFNIWSLAKNKQGHIFASVIDLGMFRSEDNGHSWHEINVGFGNNLIRSAWDILITDDIIYIAAYNRGFYQSTNNGETWRPMKKGLNNAMALSLLKTDDGKIYGGSSAGIFLWNKT
jgi:photosystem II stability/assembly factor-like uncharacterized protein